MLPFYMLLIPVTAGAISAWLRETRSDGSIGPYVTRHRTKKAAGPRCVKQGAL